MVLLPSILASSVMYRSKTASSLIHRSRLHVSSITFCFSSVVPFLSNFFSNAHSKNSLSSNLLRSVLSLKYSSGSIFFGCSTLRSLGISLTLTVKPCCIARAPLRITLQKPAPSSSPSFGISESGIKQSVQSCKR